MRFVEKTVDVIDEPQRADFAFSLSVFESLTSPAIERDYSGHPWILDIPCWILNILFLLMGSKL